jgi:acyl-CoA hydrolase/GNAT superfamily N-acetyltransferase
MDWRGYYRDHCMKASEALKLLRSGTRIFLGSACGEPQHLVRALGEAAGKLSDVEVIQVLSLSQDSYAQTQYTDAFRPKKFFVAAGGRQAVAEGRAEFTPLYLSEVPSLINEGRLALDAALIQVSPPDEHGYVSLGVSVDVVVDAVEQARVVIAQVNPSMPRTLGKGFIHLEKLDAIVEHDEPLLTFSVPPPNEIAQEVARQVAKLIPDGATIHLGLGQLPQATLEFLKDRKNLGVHSDLLTDGYVDLVEAGVITGAGKTLHPGRIVASFCLGTERIFEFAHNNPRVLLMPVRFTNDPMVIGQNHRMITVHEAVEVDLTGQVCADVVGARIYAGLGGMVDFMRGAARSPGGLSVVALTSIGPDGQSRILPMFDAGAGVLITRAGVRTVVTEYGAAYLHGLSVSERAVALIDIAHPNHRDWLLAQAKEMGVLRQDSMLAPLFTGVYPEKYEKTITLKDGTEIFMRPVKPIDERLLQEFFYSMSDREVYYRFLHSIKAFPRKDMQRMVNIDYHREMSVLALAGEFGKQEVAGVGRYILDGSELPEVDFAVQEKFQGKGLGRVIMEYITGIARDRGFKGIQAVVMSDNQASLHILTHLGYAVTGTMGQGIIEAKVHFDRPVEEASVDLKYEGFDKRGNTEGGKEEPLTRI